MRVVVHSAGIQDRDGAALVLDKIRNRFPWLELVWADGGYNAHQVKNAVAAVPTLRMEIVKRTDDMKGFVVLLSYPRLVGGARRGPPEDVGGFPGFEEFLSAMGDPTHERHAELYRWYGHVFDPHEIDHPEIAVRLAKLVRRREIGKASHAKSRNKETTPRIP